MKEQLGVVIGMSIAYIASFTGLIFAWIHYRRRHGGNRSTSGEGES